MKPDGAATMTSVGDGAPRQLDVPLDWAMPRLGKRTVPAGGRVETTSERAAWTEYDTAAGDLHAFGVVLSRRAAPDEAWTLRAGGVTTTIVNRARGVPVEFRDRLLGIRIGAALRPVRRVETQSSTHRVLGADGAEIGELVDVVEDTATVGAAATLARSRRVEVSGWSGPFVTAAVRRLVRAGGVEAGGAADEAPESVGAALHAYLRQQLLVILEGDLRLRRGENAIHPTRVAIRRLRSLLRVVDVADPDRTAALDAELAWFAGVLGEVRDRDVLREILHDAVAELAVDIDLDATATYLGSVLDSEQDDARVELAATMDGRRYLALLRALRTWRDEPPFTPAADRRIKRLARYVAVAQRQLAKRVAAAGESVEGQHRARKAAKRARYVAEFAEPVVGRAAADLGKRAKRLQERLGGHQDSVVAADFLARVAPAAPPAAAFGCGVLWVYERGQAQRARRPA